MWPNPQETEDLITFTEEILNGKLHFLCSELLVFGETYVYVGRDLVLKQYHRTF